MSPLQSSRVTRTAVATAIVSSVALQMICGFIAPCHGADPYAFTTETGSYVSSYDHMDISRLLKNEKLVSAYVKCFTNEGPCTMEGRQVKAVLLPEIIRTVCGKCSPRQKDMARQVLKHIYYTRNADFNRIMEIYDTEGKRGQIIAFMNQKK